MPTATKRLRCWSMATLLLSQTSTDARRDLLENDSYEIETRWAKK